MTVQFINDTSHTPAETYLVSGGHNLSACIKLVGSSMKDVLLTLSTESDTAIGMNKVNSNAK